MIPDVNLLVAAALEDHPHHTAASVRMADAIHPQAVSPPVLPMQVLAGFVRVVTNRRVFVNALQPEQALHFADVLLSTPGARLLDDTGAWPQLKQLCLGLRVAGPLVSDAWLAASTLHHRERLATFDRDFIRLLPPQHLELLATA